ncbi:transposase family protein [Streptomyces swartbergensis]|uniref:transposase family protein n=1 Tax=Streptomyces swartbergensis TaxID=487165 RepID=UPI0037F6221B
MVGLLLICACAVVSGARTITEIAEWAQRATITVPELLGIRRHLPGGRRAPSHATLTRLLAALDGDALDAAIGAYLAEHDHTAIGATGSAPRPAIAVDGKALSGSAHRQRRHRHLLSAVTHAPTVTLNRLAGHFDRKVHLVVGGHSAHRSRKCARRCCGTSPTSEQHPDRTH